MDYWIVKIDASGSIQWRKSFGGTGNEEPNSIQQTSDGGFIVAGYTLSNNFDVTDAKGGFDFWIVKLSSLVGVNEIENLVKNIEINPNPFSNQTSLTFELPSVHDISVLITDIGGRFIKNLNDDNIKTGTNQLSWDATNDAGSKVHDGIYFITIASENFRKTMKVVLLK